MTIESIMRMGPVIPVVSIEDIEDAIPLADALAKGGINVIEITLRRTGALDCIRAIANQRPEMTLGAGTILTPEQMQAAKDSGADFAVSPGSYPDLIRSSRQSNLPLLPGAATASEMMALMAEGITAMKFFPASVAGGVAYLQALASPLADVVFCPTGGVSLQTASDWLALPNVFCVGGSWVAPTDLLTARDFAAITDRARACCNLES